jgi:hypothetical protein
LGVPIRIACKTLIKAEFSEEAGFIKKLSFCASVGKELEKLNSAAVVDQGASGEGKARTAAYQ